MFLKIFVSKKAVPILSSANLFCETINNFSKMPKKSSSGKGSNKASSSSDVNPPISIPSPVTVGKDGEISISIQVKPGAKANTVTDISDTAVGIQISAPPVDGEANTAIVKYFAELLKVKKTDVSLKGGKSRQKTIMVSSTTGLTTENIIALLKAEQESR